MDAVHSVKELQQSISAGKSCKIAIPTSERIKKAIADAGAIDKLDTGIQLIPHEVTKILLAAICEIGTVVAKAPLEGYGVGLKRKEDELFLYFGKKLHTDQHTPE